MKYLSMVIRVPKIFVNGQFYFNLSSKMWSRVFFLRHSVIFIDTNVMTLSNHLYIVVSLCIPAVIIKPNQVYLLNDQYVGGLHIVSSTLVF